MRSCKCRGYGPLKALHHKESSLSCGCHYHCSSRGFLKLLTVLEAAPIVSLSLSLSLSLTRPGVSGNYRVIHQSLVNQSINVTNTTHGERRGSHHPEYTVVNTIINIHRIGNMHRKEINQPRTMKSGSLSKRVCFVSLLRLSRNRLASTQLFFKSI